MSEVPSSAPRKPRRVQVGWLVRLAVSAVVLTIIFRLVPVQEVWREARRLSPALWAGGVVVFLLGHAAAAAKWRLLIGPGVSFPEAFRAHLAGLAANLCLPSVAGGDVVRAGLVFRKAADPARLAACLAISMAVQVVFVGINIAFAEAAQVHAPPAAWFFAWASAKIIAIAPISLGGLGVREASMAGLLAPFGAKPAQVIAIGLIWQTVLYASGLIGLLAQVAWKPAAAADRPAPTPSAITESST